MRKTNNVNFEGDKYHVLTCPSLNPDFVFVDIQDYQRIIKLSEEYKDVLRYSGLNNVPDSETVLCYLPLYDEQKNEYEIDFSQKVKIRIKELVIDPVHMS